jgi:hypothetical protein
MAITVYYDRSLAERQESYEDYIREQTREITGSIREHGERQATATVATGALAAQRISSAIMDVQIANEQAMQENTFILDSTLQRGFSDVSRQMDSMNMTMAYGFAGVRKGLSDVLRQDW